MTLPLLADSAGYFLINSVILFDDGLELRYFTDAVLHSAESGGFFSDNWQNDFDTNRGPLTPTDETEQLDH
jgi:hypothetical protein